MTNEQVCNVFEQTEGILHGHFVLTSGRHSDTYMQCAKLFVHPKKSQQLLRALAKKLKGVAVDFVVSPAVGGIIMGYELANQLHVSNMFFERENGTMSLRRGFFLPQGAHVIVAEDVVTTGGSVKEVMEQVQHLGATVTAVCSVVDRSNGKVDFNVPFYNLLSMDVVSYAPEDCPLCKQNIPMEKPGSRSLK